MAYDSSLVEKTKKEIEKKSGKIRDKKRTAILLIGLTIKPLLINK